MLLYKICNLKKKKRYKYNEKKRYKYNEKKRFSHKDLKYLNLKHLILVLDHFQDLKPNVVSSQMMMNL